MGCSMHRCSDRSLRSALEGVRRGSIVQLYCDQALLEGGWMAAAAAPCARWLLRDSSGCYCAHGMLGCVSIKPAGFVGSGCSATQGEVHACTPL